MGVSKIIFASYTGLFHLFVDEVKHLCIGDCRERIVFKTSKQTKVKCGQPSLALECLPSLSSVLSMEKKPHGALQPAARHFVLGIPQCCVLLMNA